MTVRESTCTEKIDLTTAACAVEPVEPVEGYALNELIERSSRFRRSERGGVSEGVLVTCVVRRAHASQACLVCEQLATCTLTPLGVGIHSPQHRTSGLLDLLDLT